MATHTVPSHMPALSGERGSFPTRIDDELGVQAVQNSPDGLCSAANAHSTSQACPSCILSSKQV